VKAESGALTRGTGAWLSSPWSIPTHTPQTDILGTNARQATRNGRSGLVLDSR
jgi:hypothetical protein